MTTMSAIAANEVVVVNGVPGGVAFVPAGTPLTRLNYFDGKFLRADDLNLEQRALRAHVELSNKAGGPGVVHGLDVSLRSGPIIRLGGGMAIDPEGRVLLLPDAVEATVTALLDAGKQSTAIAPVPVAGSATFAACEMATTGPTVITVAGTDLYLVAAAHADGLCGDQEVFGRLCDDACITATDRPYRIDGVVLLLLPLQLTTPLVTSSAITLTDLHLRSRVAGAYYADEWLAGGSLLSAAGLGSNVWCLGATALAGHLVPLGVLGARGTSVVFLDQWTARRERMEAPPRRYWNGRMDLRSWADFLAQVLQFQCQLSGLLSGAPTMQPPGGACVDERLLLQESAKLIEELSSRLAVVEGPPELLGVGNDVVALWRERLALTLSGKFDTKLAAHILVDGGVCAVPPCGYLPVDSAAQVPLRDQVQDLLGQGVDLRFCAVRRDQIAHEVERAQHMERISLLAGLDDPANRQQVDILVPDGEVVTVTTVGSGFDVELALGYADGDADDRVLVSDETSRPASDARFAPRTLARLNEAAVADARRLPLRGAARVDGGDGLTFRAAVVGPAGTSARNLLRLLAVATAEDGGDVEPRLRRLRMGTHRLTEEERTEVERTVRRALLDRRAEGADNRRVAAIAGLDTAVLGLWLTLSIQADPFALAVGAMTSYALAVQAVVPGSPSSVLDLRFDGELRIRSAGGDPLEQVVTVDITVNRGDASANLGSTGRRTGGSIDVRASLTRTRTSGGERLELRGPGRAPVVAMATWAGQPTTAKAVVGRTSIEGNAASMISQRLATAVGVEDSAVGEAGNEYHDAAVAPSRWCRPPTPTTPPSSTPPSGCCFRPLPPPPSRCAPPPTGCCSADAGRRIARLARCPGC